MAKLKVYNKIFGHKERVSAGSVLFKVVPRSYKADKSRGLEGIESLLFLPDLAANPGMIVCYDPVGGHSEASLEFYRTGTTKPNPQAVHLAYTYISRFCAHDCNAVVRLKIGGTNVKML